MTAVQTHFLHTALADKMVQWQVTAERQFWGHIYNPSCLVHVLHLKGLLKHKQTLIGVLMSKHCFFFFCFFCAHFFPSSYHNKHDPIGMDFSFHLGTGNKKKTLITFTKILHLCHVLNYSQYHFVSFAI